MNKGEVIGLVALAMVLCVWTGYYLALFANFGTLRLGIPDIAYFGALIFLAYRVWTGLLR